MKTIYFAVSDANYPRNWGIRRYLSEEHSNSVAVISKPKGKNPIVKIRALFALLTQARSADVLILSEFSTVYWPALAGVAKLWHLPTVVDYFVSGYETEVLEEKRVSPQSLYGKYLRKVEVSALKGADLILVDTSVRRDQLSVLTQRPTKVVPVGIPGWITSTPPVEDTVPSVIFYGNFKPFNGFARIARMLVACKDEPFLINIVGPSHLESEAVELLQNHFDSNRLKIHGSLPPEQLFKLLKESSVVLGTFGASRKSNSVIPNKVWQALYTGRSVVTQMNPSYDSIPADLRKQIHFLTTEETAPAVLLNALNERHFHNTGASLVESHDKLLYAELNKELQRLSKRNRP